MHDVQHICHICIAYFVITTLRKYACDPRCKQLVLWFLQLLCSSQHPHVYTMSLISLCSKYLEQEQRPRICTAKAFIPAYRRAIQILIIPMDDPTHDSSEGLFSHRLVYNQ